MDARLNRISLLWGGPGLAIQILAYLAVRATTDPLLALLALLSVLGGTALLLIGLGYYAKAKGHSAAWGLFGLLSVIGLIVLACLPDKLKRPPPLPSVEGANAAVGGVPSVGSEPPPASPE